MSIKLGLLASSQQQASPLLLDTYPGAAAAYSLRKLRTAYTGPAIRVRRSSDSVQLDIGFVNNVLDTATLITFIGLNTGTITIWYDQSGNSKNLITGAFTQPSIIISGVLQIVNSKPAIFFNDISNNIFVSISLNSTTYFFDVLKSSDTNFLLYHAGDGSSFFISAGTQSSSSTGINGNATINQYFRNNTLQTSPTTRNDVYNLISTNNQILLTYNSTLLNWTTLNLSGYSGFQLSCFKQELVIYNSNQSANISGINSNINTYYSIY